MNELQFKKGLLYTSIELKYEGKTVTIKDIIVDTGASHTIISSEFLEKMDMPFSDDDELVKATGYGGTVCYSVRKKIDKISCGDLSVNNFKLDFGVIDPTDKVNGLIGLDFLINVKSIIDLVDFKIYKNNY